jgi:hypothetical protein
MRISQLTYSRSMRVNLGNYESADCGLYAQAQVDEGDDPEAIMAELKSWVADHLRPDVEALRAARKKP